MGYQGGFMIVRCALFVSLLFAVRLDAWDSPGSAAYNPADMDIRENVEIRELLKDAVTAPTSEVLKIRRRVFVQRGQDYRVAVEVHKNRDAFYILFLNEEDLRFPVFSRGSWVIKRDMATGNFIQAKIFYHSAPGSFVRIFPDRGGASQGKSLMDVYLFDRRLHRDVPIGNSFINLLSLSFADIVAATRGTVEWKNLIPPADSSAYGDIRSAADTIRSWLPKLPDAEDGAMDKNGRLVFIDDLAAQEKLPGFNCSGFAKWVADGFYAPLAGTYLDIEELKHKPLEARGNFVSRRYEDARDPFFGLDWSRNIALALARLDPGGGEAGVTSQDVRDLAYWKYREDIGFAAADVPSILYYLALTEPGNIYIASVNREFGANPVLRQHVHVVVLFPYIDEAGRFSCPVMERNVETSLESLSRRYGKDFIHLVRVKARPDFDPPVFE
jgi:hypothetical protein